MKNYVKNLAALIVFACVAVVAVCADEHNAGNPWAYAAALAALLVAVILVELDWRGCLDAFDAKPERQPVPRRRRRRRNQWRLSIR